MEEKTINTIEKDILKVLISERRLKKRVREIGAQIAADFEEKDPLFVGVLRGSFMFFADLMRICPIPCGLDFLSASSYNSGTSSSGVVKIDYDIKADIRGRHIVLVEDILDSGNTLYNVSGHLKDLGAKSVKLCVLLDKPARREKPIKPDYVGFTVPDAFVVGYGLDYADRYRNLPYIGVLKPEVYEQ